MPARAPKPGSAIPSASIDVALFALRGRQLVVLVGGTTAAGAVALPWGSPGRAESLDDGARRIARAAAGSAPGWMAQAGAFTGEGHPAGGVVSVLYVAVTEWHEPAGPWAWVPAQGRTGLVARQRTMLAAAVREVRNLTERAPVAFRMLSREFTLSELQHVYESLLGRRLHKASFRRALHASWLVEPTDSWRGEGRGRPAQLFRFASKRRKAGRRGVRFEVT